MAEQLTKVHKVAIRKAEFRFGTIYAEAMRTALVTGRKEDVAKFDVVRKRIGF